jgi:hypothetical protein
MSRHTVLAALLAALAVGAGVLSARALGSGQAPRADGQAVNAQAMLVDAAKAAPGTKLKGGLREQAVQGKDTGEVAVLVEATTQLDLGRFGRAHQFAWPAGEHVAVLSVPASALLDLAALPGVYAVRPMANGSRIVRPDAPGLAQQAETMLPPAALAHLARAAEPWGARQGLPAGIGVLRRPEAVVAGAGRGAGPTGWWDVRSGHAAQEAWALGFRGEGVTVAVLDDAVDFANYDLMNTWAVLPAGHPYAGWPQVFDPEAGGLIAVDKTRPADGVKSTRTAANGVVELYQSSAVTLRDVNGAQRPTACFKPLVNRSAAVSRELAAEACDYVVPATSKGGTVRFGHHPDTTLMGLGAREGQLGEWAGVLIVDEHTAGVYDTVYVDINNNHDFSDEKPVTKDSPLAWRDITQPADGVPDLSAGLLYWISDGQLPLPGAWVWGLDKEVPPAGEWVGFLYLQGSHGTMCASNIVSQGRLNVRPDQELAFRDLPGGLPSLNMGMAPKARMVSIGDVYMGAGSFEAGWRYAVFGHDKDRTDDDIQVASNSYGWSGTDNDNMDPDSRLIDHYVRTFSPSTTFLFATGNGGPGYGTLAPPSPSVGIDVAASTQYGSTGYDSITDTAQITFGDIIPFSNRGPGAGGSTGPDIAADGAFASGDTPINGLGDGTRAIGTWGGTSRSTPVATGATGLVYQAFKQRNGRWPTFEEARAILMSGARFNGYDTLTVGGGVLDAGDAVRIAAGLHGIYGLPGEWRAGGYEGKNRPAFPNVVRPGDTAAGRITLKNPSDKDVTVQLSAQQLRRIGSRPDSLVVHRPAESPSPGTVPDYLKAIDRSTVPAGTELLTVRGVYPYGEFDADNNLTADNYFQIGIMQHTDINGDGKLWVDRNGNGAVNYTVLGDSYVDATVEGQTTRYDSTEGAITVPLGPDGMAGPLAWYGLACNAEDGSPTPPAQDLREKIALIQRGTCTFAEKILNAQKLGAVGVVVFTDDRARVPMGGVNTGIQVAGVMIENSAGQTLRDLLVAGKTVTVDVRARPKTKGIDGGSLVDYPTSEIEPYEWARFADDFGTKNNWEISVHHPLERWADGIYLAFWHTGRSAVITDTNVTLRYDFYAYRPWPALTLGQRQVTIPANSEMTLDVNLAVPADAAPGVLAGAIFADYPRGDGDVAIQTAAAYELSGQRTVIPVIASVAADYNWQGSVALAGAPARDPDASYDNGAMHGTFKWNWRPESGDWRFFFVDATKPIENTFWLLRTRWQDAVAQKSDIDTRLFGPRADRFSNPAAPPNSPSDNWADPDWYGPYTLELLGRSPYLVAGSTWPFNTSSGGNEDWVAAPAGAGLHELLLHNVLFSGSQIDMPYDSTMSSVHMNTMAVRLYGDRCATVSMTPQIDLPGFVARGVGMAVPEAFRDQQAKQDDPADPGTSSWRKDLVLAEDAVRWNFVLDGQPEDDLDLFLMRDNNNDGQFVYPDELYAQGSNGPTADETLDLGVTPAGRYQMWVHGYAVKSASGAFTLTHMPLVGDDVMTQGVPTEVKAGQTASFQVCAKVADLAGQDGPLAGVLTIGPGGAPQLFQLPVTWSRALPTLQLPMLLKDEPLR